MKNNLYSMFSNIKNGQLTNRSFIFNQRKKICESFLKILWNEGYITGYKVHREKIQIFLKYKNDKPAINSIKLISKPGLKIYSSVKQLWKINSNKSFIIMSTDKGLKSLLDCKKLKIGGEPFIIVN